ncbi:rhodanese-like domain-containing protein [Shewanella salipaludis]|uniref:Rhodanese-like domain-containing protein n=1 Tax=Shewanella salipaludis TaxID=2723052 RepID=A0A972FTR5_9GAMM|nr:rhodanese-like domain-containing protein [Shewanella salipaludis]NMH66025.1 rhodanese-like domain-containing protein [Shewanella salipaludis]
MSHLKLAVNRTLAAFKLLLLGLLLTASPTLLAAEKDPQLAWEKIHAGAMVLDVRTAEEFSQGHLPQAVNIPFQQVAEEFAARNIPKDTPIVLYCRSGRRSGKAQEALIAAGYTQTYNGGGFEGLSQHAATSEKP